MYCFTNTFIHTAFSFTAENPLLMFRMTPNGNHMLRLLTHSSQLIADSSQLIAFIFLPLSLITDTDPSHSLRMTPDRQLILSHTKIRYPSHLTSTVFYVS